MSVRSNLVRSFDSSVGKVVAIHVLLSVAVLGVISLLVFGLWFPAPLGQIAGGLRLFSTLFAVDLVCGPVLTLLLYKSTKSRLALTVDFSLIALLQLSALSYGLSTLAQARPLAIVFEVDRFRMVSYADIAEPDVPNLPAWAKPWGTTPLRVIGLRDPVSVDERLNSFASSLSGVEAGQWPSRWQDYALSHNQVLSRSRSIGELKNAYPTYHLLINSAFGDALANRQSGETTDVDKLRWLPLVSRNTLEWVVLLDPQTLRIRAYIPLDGFI